MSISSALLDKLRENDTFTVSCGGIKFTLRRRTTQLMLEIGGIQRVLALMARRTDDEQEAEKEVAAYIEAQDKSMAKIVVAIEGEPIPSNFEWDLIRSYADALFVAFLNSSLDADPTPGSLKAVKESS